MKDKILPNEYNSYSLQELKDEANIIEKKFKEDTRQISINSKEKIQKLTSILNAKRTN